MKEKKKNEKPSSKKYPGGGIGIFHTHAAGIDVGDTMHDVAISKGDNGHEVRKYCSFTQDLKNMVEWLKSEGITTVAMESTGVYWLNLYLLLEEAGIEPYLVNAKYVKNVTGRKRDDTDAIWIQKLHSCGLLQKSFQPEGKVRTLRTYVRQRKKLIRISSDNVRRMQKALELMNIKIHTVISDILGKTGMLMIEAILNGERNPQELVKHKDCRIKANNEDIIKSLEGIWKEEYLFMLRQAYDGYFFYQSQIKQCEEMIKESLISQVIEIKKEDISGLLIEKTGRLKKNELAFNAQILLKKIVGVDLCEIDGMSEITTLELISETGTDMKKWKSDNHYAAWLNVAPNTKITGGRVISSKIQQKKNYGGLALRQAASNITKSKSVFGDYSRKMRSRIGKKGAVVAGAHKLARIIYNMIDKQVPYMPDMIVANQEIWKARRIAYLQKQLDTLQGGSVTSI